MGELRRKQRHASFQRNNSRNCRCVPKLNELHVLYHFRVDIAKLASCGSQRIHLKNSLGSTSTYKIWWGSTSSVWQYMTIRFNIAYCVLLESLAQGGEYGCAL